MEILGIVLGIIGISCLGISIWLYIKMKNERIRYLELQNKDGKGPNVVVIGGGTGQSIFLRGLKHYTQNVTAIVTVADDGGGSGVLRSDLGMLPPGDIRNCIMALANIEPTMNEVMQYRFEEGVLKGQSFGNLFLAAMNGLYGNFETAIYKIGQIFAITGRVLPVTLENVDLIATLDNGQVVKGESTIPKIVKKQKCKIEKITLTPEDCRPLDEVISSIHGADIIVMGPGSLYTSVIPNLLVPGVIDSIKKSNAKKVYIPNVMTQPGETDGYNVLDHVEALIKHTGYGLIDYIVVNNEEIPEFVSKRYEDDGSTQVLLDNEQKLKLKCMGIETIEENLIEIKNAYIRHNADRISDIIVNLVKSHL